MSHKNVWSVLATILLLSMIVIPVLVFGETTSVDISKLKGFALFKADYMKEQDWQDWIAWKTKDNYALNGAWMSPNFLLDLDEEGRQQMMHKLVAGNIKFIYLQTGVWLSNNTIEYRWSISQIQQVINYIHAHSSISVQAWVWMGGVVDISTATSRQKMINYVVNCVNLGFDGWNDDVETFDYGNSLTLGSAPDQLIAWWNQVGQTMKNMGKQSSADLLGQYAATVTPYVTLDHMIPMGYNGGAWDGSKLTNSLDAGLYYSKAPVIFGLFTKQMPEHGNYVTLAGQFPDIDRYLASHGYSYEKPTTPIPTLTPTPTPTPQTPNTPTPSPQPSTSPVPSLQPSTPKPTSTSSSQYEALPLFAYGAVVLIFLAIEIVVSRKFEWGNKTKTY
jgi:hypothetical protein